MPPLLLVMVGGAIGAGCRYQLSRIVHGFTGPGFPWGTWTINLLGGFLMGVLAGTLAREVDGGEPLRLLLGVGVLGGFTTFSSFSMETVLLVERGAMGMAVAYVGFSLLTGIGAMFLGLLTMRAVG